MENQLQHFDYRRDFLQAISLAGIKHLPREIVADGQIHRFASTPTHHNQDGWYVFYGMAGAFGDWSKDIKEKWCVDHLNLSSAELMQLKRQEQATTERIELEKQHKAQATLRIADQAAAEWEDFSILGTSAYLTQKQIEPIGIRFSGALIVIPLRDITGKLWSYQTIDGDGNKRFLAGGRKKGCFHILGKIIDNKEVYVCEGYATGVSIYTATGVTTIIAIDAGNLEAVVEAVRNQYPNTKIIIAADNDASKTSNIGREKALFVGDKFSCEVVLPRFVHLDNNLSDFNDLHVTEGISAVKFQLEFNKREELWANPLPIKNALVAIEPFDICLMPAPLQPWIKEQADNMQCPIEYLAVGQIILFATLIGSKVGIKPKRNADNWIVIPNLWGGIIGDSGSMKSPAMQSVFAPLAQLETQARQKYEQAMQKYLNEREIEDIYKKEKLEIVKKDIKLKLNKEENFKKHLMAEVDYGVINSTVTQEPIRKRYKVNDATCEKLQKLLSENPQGLLVLRDELSGLFATFIKPGHEADRAFYLETWSGNGDFTSDRINRGTIDSSRCCLSIFGSTQPDKIFKLLKQSISDAENDGFLQRFQLLVYPDQIDKWQYVDNATDPEIEKSLNNLVSIVDKMDFATFDGIKNIKGMNVFSFTDEAQEVFITWLKELHHVKLANHNEHPIIIEHLSKYKKLMPALALIFHLIDMAAQGKQEGLVSLMAVERSTAWCELLESHARRIYGLVLNTCNQTNLLAKKITLQEITHSFTLRDIYRKGWSGLKDRKAVEEACEELVQMHWLRKKSSKESSHKDKPCYIINPKVMEAKNDRVVK